MKKENKQEIKNTLKLFKELSEKQNNLDEFIAEWRILRVRSTNEVFKDRLLALIDELHEFMNASREEKNEELIDVLHFVLSLYNLVKANLEHEQTIILLYKPIEKDTELELIDLTFELNNKSQFFKYWKKDNQAFENNLEEMTSILFTMFDLIKTYFEKQGLNVSEEYDKKRIKNVMRQIDGY